MYYVQFYETQEKFGSKSSWKIMRYKQIRRIYLASKLLLFVEIACSKKKRRNLNERLSLSLIIIIAIAIVLCTIYVGTMCT